MECIRLIFRIAFRSILASRRSGFIESCSSNGLPRRSAAGKASARLRRCLDSAMYPCFRACLLPLWGFLRRNMPGKTRRSTFQGSSKSRAFRSGRSHRKTNCSSMHGCTGIIVGFTDRFAFLNIMQAKNPRQQADMVSLVILNLRAIMCFCTSRVENSI